MSAPAAVARGGSVRLLVQPLVIVAAAVGVLWWAFSRELDETQQASLNAASLTQRTLEHVQITVTVVGIVVAVGVPLGILLTRRRTRFLAPVAVGFANIGQAAPAIGLIVLLFLATNRTGFWIVCCRWRSTRCFRCCGTPSWGSATSTRRSSTPRAVRG